MRAAAPTPPRGREAGSGSGSSNHSSGWFGRGCDLTTLTDEEQVNRQATPRFSRRACAATTRWRHGSESRAGTLAQPSDLVDVAHLVTAYYTGEPDPENVDQRVAFGTSGHRGSSLKTSFNEAHIAGHHPGDLRLPARAGLRRAAVHRPGHARALRAGLGHRARGAGRQRGDRAGRRPRRLHADAGGLARDPRGQPAARTTGAGLADGIVVTPSHNPPADGGFKYNPPHGGPADTDATSVIAGARQRADRGRASAAYDGSRSRGRGPPRAAYDFLGAYVDDLPSVVDLDAIREAGVRIGADPLGGASVALLGRDRRAARARPDRGQPAGRPDVAVHDARLGRQDPDGLLVAVRDGVADRAARTRTTSPPATTPTPTGTASSRPDGGLMNPNHYLAVAIQLPVRRRAARLAGSGRIGKTLVSSSMIDRVAADLGRPLVEVPVGLQVVRARPARRVGRLRRRGVGGRVVPAPRRLGVDHRQGRHPAGPAGLGDPRAPADPRASTTPRSSPSTATRPTPASTRPPTASRRRSWPSCRPTTSPPRRWPASRSPPS